MLYLSKSTHFPKHGISNSLIGAYDTHLMYLNFLEEIRILSDLPNVCKYSRDENTLSMEVKTLTYLCPLFQIFIVVEHHKTVVTIQLPLSMVEASILISRFVFEKTLLTHKLTFNLP